MKYLKLLTYVTVVSFLLSACGSLNTATINDEKNIGYFVSDFYERLDYVCENKRQSMKNYGKFECASFPISFYMGEMKIGEISRIHSDGYVYPQDIIMLEAQAPIYISESSIKFLSVD